ncbi:DUF7672 family protein [Pontimicrobium aquaticum]|uniref:Uncharacterized protein n=1 Tax=Pontimicrobium aquaticum TaxID=2565367 RepID=A0A4U0F0X2_9FLAO|nr:hypothetical protein [Pontimicrobium aquaticum]TJY37384.1 hypothetical protein E5167_05405 [Pontimicrobium aquaticum]
MIKLYTIGIFILIVAIIANAIVINIGLKSWYDFIELLTNYEFTVFKEINVLDFLWLFIGYPMILSLGYVLGNKLYSIIF